MTSHDTSSSTGLTEALTHANETLKENLGVLRSTADEFLTLQSTVTVDYSVDGIPKLVEAQIEAKAQSERAASLHGIAIRAMSAARNSATVIAALHQDATDAVIQSSSNRYGDRSWEERGSLYRALTLNTLRFDRMAKANLARCEGCLQEIEVRARYLYRARGDLAAIGDAMKMGEAIGDLRRERDG